MALDEKIIRAKFSDLDTFSQGEIYRLHKDAFSYMDSKEYGATLKQFEGGVSFGDFLLFVSDKRFLGFQFNQSLLDSTSMKEYVLGKLYWASHLDKKDVLLKWYQEFSNKSCVGGLASIEYFENEFSSPKFSIGENDVYINTVAVSSSFQRRGIGRRLVSETINSVDSGVNLFVDCISSSPSRFLFINSGFKKIQDICPTHYDGTGSLFMGFKKN